MMMGEMRELKLLSSSFGDHFHLGFASKQFQPTLYLKIGQHYETTKPPPDIEGISNLYLIVNWAVTISSENLDSLSSLCRYSNFQIEIAAF